VQYFTLVLSEPLFIFGWALVLVLYEHWRSGSVDRRRRTAAALGLALAASALARGQGVVLVPAVLLALVLDGATRREWSFAAAGAVLPLALWHGGLALAVRHEGLPPQANEGGYVQLLLSGSPSSVFVGELRTVGVNARGYGAILSTFLGAPPTIGRIAAAVFVLALLFGAVLLRRKARALVLSTLTTAAIIVAWPSLQDRLLIPLLPFTAVVAVYGTHVAIESLFSRPAARRLARGIVALAGVLVLARQMAIRADVRRARDEGRSPRVMTPSAWIPGNAAFVMSLSKWALANTRPDDKIAVAGAPGLWLHTGRVTVPTEFAEPEGLPSVFDVPGHYLANLLASRRVSVVVVEAPDEPIARDVMVVRRRCPRALSAMPGFPNQATPQFYRVMPDSACIVSLVNSLRPASPPAH
jgi:hypothetical protein